MIRVLLLLIMAVPFVYAVGTESKSNGNASPGVPSGTTTNDVMIALAASDATPTGPGGSWTEVTFVGSTIVLSAYLKRAGASESAPTITNNGSVIVAGIVGVRGALQSGNPINTFDTLGDQSSLGSSLSINGITTTIADCLVLVGVANNYDDNSDDIMYSGWSNFYQAPTERFDHNSQFSTGAGLGAATFDKVAAGFTSTIGVTTIDDTAVHSYIVLAIKPAVAASFLPQKKVMPPILAQ